MKGLLVFACRNPHGYQLLVGGGIRRQSQPQNKALFSRRGARERKGNSTTPCNSRTSMKPKGIWLHPVFWEGVLCDYSALELV